VADGAAEVWFYHLERTGLDQALPELLEKTLRRGWRAIVRTREAERAADLDARLWTYRDDSFLPHGLDHEPGAARQPILLTTGRENANGAQALFLVDGAELGDLSGYARCVVVFDGGDERQLATARGQFRAAKAAGAAVSYWKQLARGWEKQA
jgi:DNA polymerase-3 subunit chi